jgi:hypothetical protein
MPASLDIDVSYSGSLQWQVTSALIYVKRSAYVVVVAGDKPRIAYLTEFG